MLLRISLVIVILAGLGALYFTHFNIQETVTTLRQDVETAQTNEQRARAAEQEAKSSERQAREERDEATRQLDQRTAALEETSQRLADEERRANRLAGERDTLTRERNDARQELASWRAFDLSLEQIRTRLGQFARVREERDAFAGENEILMRRVSQLEADLSRYVGDPEVQLPAGLKGTILAVDPRYDFVVIDIGENQGVRENGKLLVNRNGKLIARIQVTRVQADRSIANVLQDWKQDEVMEGDTVVY